MLTRAQKQEQIDALKATLAPASGLFVMEFAGLTVGEVTELRRKVKEAKGSYQVVKNTLAKLSMADTAHQSLQQLLSGPAALAFTSQDAVVLAKALRRFRQDARQAEVSRRPRRGAAAGCGAGQAGRDAALQEGVGGEAAVPAAVADAQAGDGARTPRCRGLAVSLQQIAEKKGTPDEGVREQAKEN